MGKDNQAKIGDFGAAKKMEQEMSFDMASNLDKIEEEDHFLH
jgi:hypothetical protein